jgi:predicted  nucleic acid-binding Zn-ribbon protein
MYSELVERHGETQRELGRCREKVQEDAVQLESLSAELLQARNDANGAIKESQDLQLQLDRVKQGLYESAVQSDSELQDLRSQISDLANQNADLKAKCLIDEEKSKQFDDYKKRAQLTLNKVRCCKRSTFAFFFSAFLAERAVCRVLAID